MPRRGARLRHAVAWRGAARRTAPVLQPSLAWAHPARLLAPSQAHDRMGFGLARGGSVSRLILEAPVPLPLHLQTRVRSAPPPGRLGRRERRPRPRTVCSYPTRPLYDTRARGGARLGWGPGPEGRSKPSLRRLRGLAQLASSGPPRRRAREGPRSRRRLALGGGWCLSGRRGDRRGCPEECRRRVVAA
jgi:hypothetical protein